jgi:hypothetical protein
MVYLLAAVAVLAVVVVLWRVLTPVRGEQVGVAAGRTRGPDDDPDFLRRLAEQLRREADEDPDD